MTGTARLPLHGSFQPSCMVRAQIGAATSPALPPHYARAGRNFNLTGLGLPEDLERVLSPTISSEPLQPDPRDRRCVKHWHGGTMTLRWTAAGLHS
jgi:hypothetical protein